MALATLSIDFVASLAKLQASMAGASGIVRNSAQQMTRSFTGLKATLGTLGVSLGVAGALAFTKSLRDGILAIKDLSEATGASFENISSFENVLRNAGQSLEDGSGVLIKFNMALKDVGENKDVAAAFKAIGVNVEQLKRLDPVDAIIEVARALDGFADSGSKARIIQELFGKSIAVAGPLLKELAEQGKVQSTVSKDLVLQTDRFNKELAEMGRHFTDTSRTIFGSVLPSLNAFLRVVNSQGFTAALDKLGRSIGQRLFGADSFDQQTAKLEATIKRLNGYRAEFEGRTAKGTFLQMVLGITPEQVDRELLAATAQLQALRALALGVGDDANAQEVARLQARGDAAREARLRKLPDLIAAVTDKTLAAVGPSQAWADALNAVANTDAAKVQRLTAAIAELQRSREIGGGLLKTDETEDAINALRDELQQLTTTGKGVLEAVGPTQEFADALDALTGTRSEEVEKLERAIDALAETRAIGGGLFDAAKTEEAINALRERLASLKKPLGEVADFARAAAESIQQSLGSTLERVLGGHFEGIGRMWLDTIRRMVAQALAAKLNQQLFGSFLSGGSLGPWGSAIVNIFGAGTGKTASSAGGASSGKGALAFGGGGGTTYAPTFNVYGDVGPATVALIESMIARERGRVQREQLVRGAA